MSKLAVQRRALMALAMKCCDYWGDDAAGRAEMRAEIKAVSDDEVPALLSYFKMRYGDK